MAQALSSGETKTVTALELAREANALVQVDPRRALAVAEQALARAKGDPRAEVESLYALSWAQHEVGDRRAAATARTGIRIAERNGDRRGAGLLRRRLATSYSFAGRHAAAQREIDRAVELLSGTDRAQTEVFRLFVHMYAEPSDPALRRQVYADARDALRLLRRTGDRIWEARLLFNRGLLHKDRGELTAADADLRQAFSLYSELGLAAAAIDALVLLGEIARLNGDLPAALTLIAKAEAMSPPGHLSFNLEQHRVEALAQARLLPEARAAARAFVELCTRTSRQDQAAVGLLDLAAIELMSEEPNAALQVASRAVRLFAAREKPLNEALARLLGLRARLAGGRIGRTSVGTALEATAVLARGGWRRDALRGHLAAARIALAAGSLAVAQRELAESRPLRSRGTVADRVELCQATALLLFAEGKRDAAMRQLRQGLQLLDDYRGAFGAAELRATASGIGAELSQLGLRLAFDSGEPEEILGWAESLRGNALRLPSVRPPADPELRALETELRRSASELRAAEADGKPAAAAAKRQADLERAIRARTRLLEGMGGGPAGVPDLGGAAKALGDRALVEYVHHEGSLAALTLARGQLRLHDLGPADGLAEVEWLRFALARFARSRAAADRAAARASAAASAAALDALLVEPILAAIDGSELVIVPTGALHATPWAALPSLAGRPVTVSPSLALWLELRRRRRGRRRQTVLVAGPRLPQSRAEVRSLAGLYDDPAVLEGERASVETILAALDGAALAHLACHGRFRADSPLFSSLELADGPLNVYELQHLRRAPELVVLSACDLAVSGLHPGDELLGLASALLGLGTRTIVASVVPVLDTTAKRLMLAFHRRLGAGDSPAAALAYAQQREPAASFVCLGAG